MLTWCGGQRSDSRAVSWRLVPPQAVLELQLQPLVWASWAGGQGGGGEDWTGAAAAAVAAELESLVAQQQACRGGAAGGPGLGLAGGRWGVRVQEARDGMARLGLPAQGLSLAALFEVRGMAVSATGLTD
jgi:hypothetical protein